MESIERRGMATAPLNQILGRDLIRTFHEAWRVIHRRHGDRERLRGAGIDAAIGGAAIVVDLHAHRRRAVRVGGRRIGQGPVGRHRRLRAGAGGIFPRRP